MTTPLISIRNLCVDYITDAGDVRACNNVSFDIAPGEVFGLAGESGCGKSTVAFSLMRLHKPPAFITGGEVIFNGENILQYSDDRMQAFRWSQMSMVFQSAMNALNPVLTMEDQFCDVIMRHTNMTREQAKRRAEGLLEIVDIHASRLSDYPHQFSGGMRQRVMIAMALACNPKVLIADEPTTALDVTIQAQILDLMVGLNKDFGTAIILITHDLGVVAEVCQRVVVMYAGRVVEEASAQDLFTSPQHPYTIGLLSSIPVLGASVKEKLVPIAGLPPDLLNPPSGCRFAPRCSRRQAKCAESPPLASIGPHRKAACWFPGPSNEAARPLDDVIAS